MAIEPKLEDILQRGTVQPNFYKKFGMSFQIVNVYLKNGTTFLRQKVFYSEELVLENDESIDVSAIAKIELVN